MAYSGFTLAQLKEQFQLEERRERLFTRIPAVQPSAWLQETLALGYELPPETEKERSERIVSPILLECLRQSRTPFAFFSGVTMEGDASLGLTGECDFILSNKRSVFLESAIFGLVEAKRNDVLAGVPQCVAQMLGARLFNRRQHSPIETIYGCVTTGEEWLFLLLIEQRIIIDREKYFISNLADILGILNT